MRYIPIHTILKVLEDYNSSFGGMRTVPDVIGELCDSAETVCEEFANPLPESASDLQDEEFIRLFSECLFPADYLIYRNYKDLWRIDVQADYKSELIYAFRHLNFARQQVHIHNAFEITYVFKGHCAMCFENDRIEMREGHTCIIAPISRHEIVIDDPDSVIINIGVKRKSFECAFMPIMLQNELTTVYLYTILYQKNMPNYLYIPTENTRAVRDQLKQLICTAHVRDPYSQSSAVSQLGVFFSMILKNYQDTMYLYHYGNPTIRDDYMALLQYIQNNYTTVTLDSTAKFFNYNKTYLSRLISRLTGKSFSEIITELKLNKACSLLLNSEKKISEIAEICGYTTLDYFSKTFKKYYQMSPSVYREEKII